jgi:hypothetical protein
MTGVLEASLLDGLTAVGLAPQLDARQGTRLARQLLR